MEHSLLIMLWITAGVLTLAAFYLEELILSLMSMVCWAAMSLAVLEINYIGFGSNSTILYTYRGTSGEVGLSYLFGMIALVMLVYTFHLTYRESKEVVA